MKTFRHPLTKGLLSGLWVILFGLLLHRDYFLRTIDAGETAALDRARRIEYQSIYFNKQKIGFVENHFTPIEGDRLEIRQKAIMRLNISGQSHPVDLDLTAILGPSDNLVSFAFDFTSPFYQMEAQGKVEGNRVSFSLDTGNSTIEDSVVLEGAPMLSTSRRSYLLGLGIKEGEKVKIPWFDPVSLTAKQSMIEYRGQERVLINNRVYYLHRFTELFSGARINSWLDDEGNVIKEESPAGFVFVKEPEFKAKLLNSGSEDLLSSVSVKIDGTLPDLSSLKKMRYRLTLPPDTQFDLDGGRQHFADGILTVNLETIPANVSAGSSCKTRESDLQASPYIQVNAPEIVELSQDLSTGFDIDFDRVRAITDWVYHELDKRPVIGIPDALTTLKSKIGDCNEHASLFAALARAAGIPTRIAAGVVFHNGAFYYHAWNEVCLSGQWLSIDTTTNQIPADLSHIKFIEGELQEQIRIGSLLNVLKIEPLRD